MLSPAIVLAQEAATEVTEAATEAVQAVASSGDVYQVLAILLTVLGTPLAILATALILKALKKMGIETTDAISVMARTQADFVIDQVEAWANKKAQEGAKPDSQSKLSKGIGLLKSALDKTSLDESAVGKLEHILEERLLAREMVKKADPS